jgi:hypothetical protein
MPILLILLAVLIGGRPDPAPPAGAPAAIRPEDPAPAAAGSPSAPACAAAPDGAVLLVWEFRDAGREPDILFSRRDPGPEGGWLADPLRLNMDPPGAARSLEPRIAVGRGATVHVAWQDARDGKDDVLVRRSTDGGGSWEAEIRVDGDGPGASLSSMPALAADGRGRVYVAWEDQRNGDRDIYLARSTDGGRTFWPEVRVDADEPGAGVSYHPDLLCWDDGTVLVFWRDERDGLADVYLRRSTDGGNTWGPEKWVDLGGSSLHRGGVASMHLGVAAIGRRVAAVWHDVEESVRVRVSEDAGGTWSPPFGVSRHPNSGHLPEDPLVAAAASRGIVPAGALAGNGLRWAGRCEDGIWYVYRTDSRLQVARRGASLHDILLDAGSGSAGAVARPSGITGTGLPDGGLFLVWVRETDAGPRLETVILPPAPR